MLKTKKNEYLVSFEYRACMAADVATAVAVVVGQFTTSIRNASKNRWFFHRNWPCEGDLPRIRLACNL